MYTSTAPRTAVESYFLQFSSPIGRIEVLSDGESITGLTIERGGVLPHDGEGLKRLVEEDGLVGKGPAHSAPPSAQTTLLLEKAAAQLREYFAGARHRFDLPIRLHGTAFQQQIWNALGELPWGGVSSYGELGAATGRASAGRAVGGAVGANPIPIIVPCHRVLASNGKITGYSAGNGVTTKMWLLDHEGIEHRS